MSNNITTSDLANDIPLELAQAAHNGTSWTPETRATQERDGYAREMFGIWEELNAFARNDTERAQVAAFFPRFRSIVASLRREYLGSRSNVVSWAIAGPSNFPARRMEKRARWAHNKLEHMLAVKEKLLARIKRDMRPERKAIMSGDSDAITRLQEKIAQAETLQARMKAANAIVRKFKNDKKAGYAALEQQGLSASHARSLFEPDFCGQLGFADFELTNNNANIRRMKLRLAAISQNRATPATEQEGTNARLEDSPRENRVRLFFPGKPDETTRSRLKSRGFRWTPSLGCWQAYRNATTLHMAQAEAGIEREAAK